tara:strand:+ start:1294 stop:1548 length:255 start_codon:yes stop_codon:yes gene_type:complete
MLIINIIGIAWLLTHYSEFIEELNVILKHPKKIILIPGIIMNCLMCSSFWVGLVMSGGQVGLSAFISLLMYLLDKYLISTEIKL